MGPKNDENDSVDQLQEDISQTALKMPSALTPAYKASLDAVDLLENGAIHSAVGRLWDASAYAERDSDSAAFRSLAERAEKIPD